MADPTRYLVSDPVSGPVARELFASTASLPLVCPHGHVDPLLFSDPNYHFTDPVKLMIQPDHYVLRILHSQGVPYQKLGIPVKGEAPVEEDPRKIWQIFADHFYCYAATPTGLWIKDEMADVFGIEEKLTGKNAQAIYTAVQNQLNASDFTPRKLYERFNIAVLCTTDAASDSLQQHQKIASSAWTGHILPTFRSDTIVHIERPIWVEEIAALGNAASTPVEHFNGYLQAIESRRGYFKHMGATATDLAVVSAETAVISAAEMEALYQKGLQRRITDEESARFISGMVVELARMSTEDGLVMQLHVGSYRNHDTSLFENAGPDLGADFPVPLTFTRPLQPLLNRFGNHPNFHLILFTLDETTYARELAPLASYYPSVKLGPPWWFHDNLNGMQRFFEQAIDSGGLYNTVGFNDDTRAFLSIPARHDVWRRASANWLAGLLVRHIVDETSAYEMMKALACGLALKAYQLEQYAPSEGRMA
jgi:glucuronate isomerase